MTLSTAEFRSGDVPIREGYDRWAIVYDDDANPLIAVEEPVFADLLGDVAGLRALDVGCGTGRHSLAMARRGASVTGVDFSAEMLIRARAKPGAESVTWIEHDVTRRLPLPDASFDVVVSALVLDHIEDLDAFFGELRRLCAPGGRVICTVMHPAMMLRGVRARFVDPVTGEKIHVQSATNMISDYIAACVGSGLRIDHVSEHAVEKDVVLTHPRAAPYLGWPMLMAMRLLPG